MQALNVLFVCILSLTNADGGAGANAGAEAGAGVGAGALTKYIQNVRDARLFWNTITEFKVRSEVVTSLAPSSCVQVEATLPPCRSVRNLDPLPEFFNVKVPNPYAFGKQLQNADVSAQLEPNSTSRRTGWAEFLGLAAPTTVITKTNVQTTTLYDHRTMVTFSVKGCRPSRLPLGLERCPDQLNQAPELIIPTPTVPLVPTSPPTPPQMHEIAVGDGLRGSRRLELEPSVEDAGLGQLSSEETQAIDGVIVEP